MSGQPSGDNPQAGSETPDGKSRKRHEADQFDNQTASATRHHREQHVKGSYDDQDGRVESLVAIEPDDASKHRHDPREENSDE
jgi:hypothetical protein